MLVFLTEKMGYLCRSIVDLATHKINHTILINAGEDMRNDRGNDTPPILPFELDWGPGTRKKDLAFFWSI